MLDESRYLSREEAMQLERFLDLVLNPTWYFCQFDRGEPGKERERVDQIIEEAAIIINKLRPFLPPITVRD